MAWFEGVLEVDGAQISPGGTSLGLSTPMATDLRHTASVLGRLTTVGGGGAEGGASLCPPPLRRLCAAEELRRDIVPKPRFFTIGFQF